LFSSTYFLSSTEQSLKSPSRSQTLNQSPLLLSPAERESLLPKPIGPQLVESGSLSKRSVVKIKKSRIKSHSGIAVLATIGLWTLRVLIGILAVATIYPAVKMYQFKSKLNQLQDGLKNELTKQSLLALNNAYQNEMKESWPEPHHPELKKHFQKIKEAIESPPDEDPVINKKRLQSFYEAYNALHASPPYAELADGDLGRAFIERLGVVMVEEVEGIKAYADFDDKVSGSEKAPENLKAMADQLRDRLTDPKYLKRDHFWEKRMWEFFSAKGPYESVRSEFTGVHFDSVLQGNMLSKAWDFGDPEIYAILGGAIKGRIIFS
jgi:hypothetical protein